MKSLFEIITVTMPVGSWGTANEIHIENLPKITWLVGPNGAGKTNFLQEIKGQLRGKMRFGFLGIDRTNEKGSIWKARG